jgi:alpha-beta hydrolase superfamily lysophospholipase
MKKPVIIMASGALALYLAAVGLLYLVQERIIFFPQKLDKDYRFAFEQEFEELSLPMNDGVHLSGLLFRAEASKGLIFYLHGNAGSLASWGTIAKPYTELGYDLFILDYRGFGKSEGRISSEAQLHEDVSAVYNHFKIKYKEQDIVILGYSIGTGPAARLAAGSNAKLLILQAPYYNLKGLMSSLYPFIPTSILRYQFETNRWLRACKMPVALIHGDQDEVIPHEASLQLKELLKPADTLIILKDQAHSGISDNAEYRKVLKRLLDRPD